MGRFRARGVWPVSPTGTSVGQDLLVQQNATPACAEGAARRGTNLRENLRSCRQEGDGAGTRGYDSMIRQSPHGACNLTSAARVTHAESASQ